MYYVCMHTYVDYKNRLPFLSPIPLVIPSYSGPGSINFLSRPLMARSFNTQPLPIFGGGGKKGSPYVAHT